MSITIPDSHKDLFEKPIYAVVTTIMPDGQPQSSIMWVDYDGEYVRINTARGRQKDKNLSRDPKVTLLLMDPQDPFCWIEVRGTVVEMTEDGGREHIESLSRKYTGQKYYGGFNQTANPDHETRVLIKIRPTRVVTFPRQR